MRRKGKDEGQGTEGWLTTYGDLMTLLLCFFVLLFAYSSIDSVKFQEVILSLRGALGIMDSGPSLLHESVLPAPSARTQMDIPTDRRTRISQLVTRVAALLEARGIEGVVGVREDTRGVVIRFRDAVLFDFARHDVKASARPLLDDIAEILAELEYEILIEGHTDDIPTRPGSIYESNWDLSTRRAVQVLSYFLEESGLAPPERFAAAGYGEYRPIVENDTEGNRALNRRVDIVLLVPDRYDPEPPEVQATEMSEAEL